MVNYPDTQANGPTATSNAKDVQVKSFRVARTNTTASVLAVIPQDATILNVSLSGSTASDAATTATVSVGTTSTSNEWINAFDVKGTTGSGQNFPPMVAGLGNLSGLPAGTDVQVYAKYAETGTASTTGGPWYINIYYTR
jgi:hypothetical protein